MHRKPPPKGSGVSITISFRDRTQFYQIIAYCNRTYGKGVQFWTSRPRILRYIDPTKPRFNPPRIVDLEVFVPSADPWLLQLF